MGNLLTIEWCRPSSCCERLDHFAADAGGNDASIVFAKLPGRVRRKDLLIPFAVELGAVVLKGPLGGIVDEHVAAVEILDPRQAGQVLHELGEPLLAFAERFGGLLLSR